MMGISYGGFTSLQIASHAPEHLTSIIDVLHRRPYTDDCHFRGGLMRKYYGVTSYAAT
jgi:predicted acyl esterase